LHIYTDATNITLMIDRNGEKSKQIKHINYSSVSRQTKLAADLIKTFHNKYVLIETFETNLNNRT